MTLYDSEIVIVDAARTAIGNFNGSLAKIPAHQLGAHLISALLKRNKLDEEQIDDLIIGQVLTAGQGQNPARQTAIKAGLTHKTTATTINQVCGSGLKSVAMAAMQIATGNANIMIAGGQENMSLAPHAAYVRSGIKMGNTEFVDTMMHDGLTDIFNNYPMGITAENVAKKYKISREEQDKFAVNSQQKASAAVKAGKFKEEIIPIEISSRKETISFELDEFIKHDVNLDKLSKLKPAFTKEGVVTAGNSSGINDGAAMILLMTKKQAEMLNLKPIAKIVSWAQAGVEPEIMGTGPIDAVKKCLAKAQWNINQLDLIESNEAFAAQAIAVNKGLGWDEDKINVNGGSLAIGHPIGASGARVLTTLLYEMKRREGAHKALATLCIGGGMGVALAIEKL
jgi:acetyl-CoA C-acetyltransferase